MRRTMLRPLFTPKAIRFQLTALMDLLLIIVFAQFLEIRQRADESTEAQTQQLARIESDYNVQLESARQSIAAQSAKLERSMNVVKQLFQLDESTANEAMLDRIRERARELAEADPDTILRFLISHEELLKRAEVWTIHGSSTGEIKIAANSQVQSFRLESSTQDERTEEFTNRLFAAYKQLTQPKNLVVILVSYDLRSTAGVYQSMIDGMPRAIDRLRPDASSVRFEYTIIGPTEDPLKEKSL